MSYARQMLDACRVSFNVDSDLLAATIDALNDCAQACIADTGCDLGEENVGVSGRAGICWARLDRDLSGLLVP